MAGHPFQNFVVRYGGGERIFSEGDLGTTMYIVQAGKVRLFRVIDGAKRVHGVMEKGDFFGEMSILEGLPRITAAEAVEDSELIEINSMTFDKMIKGNIEIAIRMLRKLSLRLREAERRLESAQAAPPPTHGTPRPAPRPSRPEGSGPRLTSDDDGGAEYALEAGETLIGRFDPVTEMKPDIDLTQVDLKRSVSRRHARIVASPDGAYSVIEEIGALNGTFVNGEKVQTGKPHGIVSGDVVAFGTVKLVFHA